MLVDVGNELIIADDDASVVAALDTAEVVGVELAETEDDSEDKAVAVARTATVAAAVDVAAEYALTVPPIADESSRPER